MDQNKLDRLVKQALKIYCDASGQLGLCNCKKCVEERRNITVRDFYLNLFPQMNDIPNILNPKANRLSMRYQDISYWDIEDQLAYLIDQFSKINLYNGRRIGNWTRNNIPFTYCVDCGKIERVENTHTVHSAERNEEYQICTACLHEGYHKCEDCGNIYYVTDMSYTNVHWHGKDEAIWLCNSCRIHWTPCRSCGALACSDEVQWWDVALMQLLPNRYSGVNLVGVCPKCVKKPKDKCEVCKRELWSWEQKSAGGYDIICSICYENSRLIHEWEWKPNPIFQLSKRNPNFNNTKLFYGAEIEIEQANSDTYRHEMAHALLDKLGHDLIYIKTDASLTQGIEIVTHPYSWQTFLDRRDWFKDMWKTFLDYGYSANYSDHTGQHFHMTKKAFTTLHLYKFLNFIYSSSNRRFIIEIAQRHENEYAKFRYDDSTARGQKSNAKHKSNASDERHSAVNLTKATTVEIRIFKCTDDVSMMFKNMEFLQSLYEFTRDSSVNDMNVPMYWKFLNIKKNRARFRNLYKFISKNANMKFYYSIT